MEIFFESFCCILRDRLIFLFSIFICKTFFHLGWVYDHLIISRLTIKDIFYILILTNYCYFGWSVLTRLTSLLFRQSFLIISTKLDRNLIKWPWLFPYRFNLIFIVMSVVNLVHSLYLIERMTRQFKRLISDTLFRQVYRSLLWVKRRNI